MCEVDLHVASSMPNMSRFEISPCQNTLNLIGFMWNDPDNKTDQRGRASETMATVTRRMDITVSRSASSSAWEVRLCREMKKVNETRL